MMDGADGTEDAGVMMEGMASDVDVPPFEWELPTAALLGGERVVRES